MQAHTFLAGLIDLRRALDIEQTRLVRFRGHLETRLADSEALADALGTRAPDDARIQVHHVVQETARLAGDEQDRLEAGL